MKHFSLIIMYFVIQIFTYNVLAQNSLLQKEFILESKDSMFNHPYVDKDEWRDTPVKHHYIHGGFKDTNTRFSFYFPEVNKYEGRFFQYITPIPDNENLSQTSQTKESDKISFSISSGAYFIETNGGGQMQKDFTIAAFRANAASAQFSRILAKKIFNTAVRPFGYAFGGSGGSLRTLGSIENTSGVWDGVVPYVMPAPISIPNSFTSVMLASRILKNKLPDIIDALDAGSQKKVLDVLDNVEQKAAYNEITAMGFPPGAWKDLRSSDIGAFSVIYPTVLMSDPDFFTDFWTKEGYDGYKPTQSLKDARVKLSTKIKKVILAKEALSLGINYDPFKNQNRGLADNAWKAIGQNVDSDNIPVAIQLENVPMDKSNAYELTIKDADGKNQKIDFQSIFKDIVILKSGNNQFVKDLKVNDELVFDNSNLLAVQYYHRYQVPGKEFYVYDQYKDSNGKPIYPQREKLLGPVFTNVTAGSIPDGKFEGKMILIQNMYDGGAFPWHADWYKSKVKAHVGSDINNHFRVWFTDHANHGDYPFQVDPTNTVVYLGVLQQALRDLSAWAEKGIAPPSSTNYTVQNGQIILPSNAKKRSGIQPVVSLLANKHKVAKVKVDENIKLDAEVQVPTGAGKIVSVEWNFDGSKDFSILNNSNKFKKTICGNKIVIHQSHSFNAPGVYFITIRVASQREGDSLTPFTRIQNLDRVRVIVE